MGSSSSIPSYHAIAGSCTQLSSVEGLNGLKVGWTHVVSETTKIEQGLQFGNSVDGQIGKDILKGGYTIGLNQNFNGINFTALLSAAEKFNFDSAVFCAGVPIDDGCNASIQAQLGENGSGQFSGDVSYESDVVNTSAEISYIREERAISITGNASFSPLSGLYAGFNFSTVPKLLSAQVSGAAMVQAGFAQFGLSITKQFGNPEHLLTSGMNLVLDRGLLLNIAHVRAGFQSETKLGLLAEIGKNTVNTSLSFNGCITSKFTRQVTDDIKIAATVSVCPRSLFATGFGLEVNLISGL